MIKAYSSLLYKPHDEVFTSLEGSSIYPSKSNLKDTLAEKISF